MKKIMALFVALLMLLSVVSMAFAQEANETVSADAEITETGAPAEAAETETTDVVVTADTETITEAPAEIPTDAPLCTDASFTCGTCYQESEGQYLSISKQCPSPEPPVVNVPEDAQVTVTEVPAEETGVVTAEEVDEAGITPDQPVLWGLERAIERVSLALTLGKSAKAQKGLAHARERLMEVKTMIAEKKLDKAEKAREQHGKALGRVKQAVEEINGDNQPEDALQEQTNFESELEEQENELEQTREKARTRLNLTSEQQAKIAALVNEFNGDVSDAKVRVELKKNKVKIAIQAKTGKSSEEVDKLDNDMKAKSREEIRAVKREANQEVREIKDEARGEIQQVRTEARGEIQQIKTGAGETDTGSEDESDQAEVQQQTQAQDQVDVGGAVSIESDEEED